MKTVYVLLRCHWNYVITAGVLTDKAEADKWVGESDSENLERVVHEAPLDEIAVAPKYWGYS